LIAPPNGGVVAVVVVAVVVGLQRRDVHGAVDHARLIR